MEDEERIHAGCHRGGRRDLRRTSRPGVDGQFCGTGRLIVLPDSGESLTIELKPSTTGKQQCPGKLGAQHISFLTSQVSRIMYDRQLPSHTFVSSGYLLACLVLAAPGTAADGPHIRQFRESADSSRATLRIHVRPEFRKATASRNCRCMAALGALASDGSLSVSIVHRRSSGPLRLAAVLDDFTSSDSAEVHTLAAAVPWAANPLENPDAVKPLDSSATVQTGKFELDLQPYRVVRLLIPQGGWASPDEE